MSAPPQAKKMVTKKVLPRRTAADIAMLERQREMELMRKMFRSIDRDGGGTINQEELEEMMKTLGMKPSKEEVMTLMDAVDADKSGAIDINEFAEVMTRKVNMDGFPSTSQIKKAFDCVVRSAYPDLPAGKAPADEMIHIVRVFGKMETERAKAIVEQMEIDKKGLVDYEKYILLILGDRP
jgi:Ca2+-binding EF-hand superfamily protein